MLLGFIKVYLFIRLYALLEIIYLLQTR